MKHNYEDAYKYRLPARMPVIVRLDGNAFHTFTREMSRPFDNNFIQSMAEVARQLCEYTHTCELAYVQSDEISLLLHPYKKLETQPIFDGEINKINSILAGRASSTMTLLYGRIVAFDCRCMVMPEAEVANYFIWRQKDFERNSIQMLAQSVYTHSQLHGKTISDLHGLCFAKGLTWGNLPTQQKRGLCVVKIQSEFEGVISRGWEVDFEIPIFTSEAGRAYIESRLATEPDMPPRVSFQP